MSTPEPEPTLDVARGDAAMSKHLRNTLGVLRSKVDDPQFKSLVDDVLSGRRSLRDTMRLPEFSRALDPLAAQGAETYRNLSDEEKEELSRQGEEGLEQLREDAAASSSDDDDDPDDEDFSDRSWLQ